jgi:hypothetical protein
MYSRKSDRIFFLLPTLAVGIDEYGYVFMEAGWLNLAIGIGISGKEN